MAKRGLGKGLGAFFGEEVANTKETSGEKVSRSERKEQLMGKTAEKKPENTAKNTEKRGIAGNGDAGKSSVVKNQENQGKNKNGVLDKITSMFCYVGISIPTFWFGIMLIYLFSVHLHILPSIGMHSDGNRSLGDLILHMVMPCAVLTFANASQYIRYLRSSTITEMSSDYVMVQKAYGMKESGILFRHVLKNAMLPMITVLGMSLQSLVSGAIITEQVFAWPGIGQLAVTAVMQYDYPLIMGITMFTALLVVLGNLLADVLYAVFDPRIRKAGC